MADTLTKWEYLQWGTFIDNPTTLIDDERNRYLRTLGEEGWELVSTMVMPYIKTDFFIRLTKTSGWTVVYIFKRPIKI